MWATLNKEFLKKVVRIRRGCLARIAYFIALIVISTVRMISGHAKSGPIHRAQWFCHIIIRIDLAALQKALLKRAWNVQREV